MYVLITCVQGVPSSRRRGWVFLDFHFLLNSALSYGNSAEVTRQEGKMVDTQIKVNTFQVYEQMRHPVF